MTENTITCDILHLWLIRLHNQIEAQATDRAFRIGQTRNVQVHRFITKGTFEEKINALLETKKSIANMTVSAGETWLADMDDKQLGEVFGLDNTLV